MVNHRKFFEKFPWTKRKPGEILSFPTTLQVTWTKLDFESRPEASSTNVNCWLKSYFCSKLVFNYIMNHPRTASFIRREMLLGCPWLVIIDYHNHSFFTVVSCAPFPGRYESRSALSRRWSLSKEILVKDERCRRCSDIIELYTTRH